MLVSLQECVENNIHAKDINRSVRDTRKYDQPSNAKDTKAAYVRKYNLTERLHRAAIKGQK